MTKPLVSISCITYNHINFIRDAIEGFLMQKTNFPFEILIHDDYSTDGTEDVIREYEKKYPDIIKPIYEKENQWSKGIRGSLVFNFPRAQGKYMALCEGDDYWTDPLKLQKQVDFLEANPDFSVCFHPVKVIQEDGSKPDEIFPSFEHRFKKDVLGLEDLLVHNFIQTNSVMYRWRFVNENIKDFFPKDILPGDWFLHMLHAQKGKIGFIDEVMAVYRRHKDGLWWESDKNADILHLKHGIQELNFHENVYKIFANSSKQYFESKVLPFARYIMNLFLVHKEFDKLKEFSELYKNYYERILKEMQSNSQDIQQKDQEIQNMKSSKFWKLQEKYMKLRSKFIK